MTRLIQTIGFGIAALMGIGAVFGAILTMYTAVATRAREIATLRALGFDTGAQDGDEVIEAHGVTVLIDPFSLPYLDGADIDFVDGLNGTGFSITNPNTVSGCGCGSSFQLKEGEEEGDAVTASAGGCTSCGHAH